MIEGQISDWLSFEKKGALLKDSLEGIRMRVVLDSLVTKMARAELSGAYRNSLELSAAEKSRLVAFMLDADTSEKDFRDAARVLGAHLGIFFPGTDTKIDELLSKTMSRFESDSYRPRILLETLKRYQGIGKYAKGIVENKNSPNDLRESALLALASLYHEEAVKYSLVHLPDEQYSPLQDAEAKILANEQNAVPLVDQWIAKKTARGEGIDARLMLADVLAPGAISIDIDDKHQKWAIDRAAQLLITAISKGAAINYDDNFFPRVDLAFRTDSMTHFRRTDALFSNISAFMSALVKMASSNRVPAEVFVRALTTQGHRGETFGLSVILNSSSIIGETFGRIDKTNSAGPLLLVAGNKKSPKNIQVSFRAKDGKWITDQVKDFDNFYEATINFAYDERIIQMTQSRELNNIDILVD